MYLWIYTIFETLQLHKVMQQHLQGMVGYTIFIL